MGKKYWIIRLAPKSSMGANCSCDKKIDPPVKD